MGYRMVIWPVSALRVAAKAQAELYATLRRDGATPAVLPKMRTRARLYATIGYEDYKRLDKSIAMTVLP